MKRFLGLTRRNLLVYFKDVQAVLFSMLTSIILFVLYLLFLRQTYVDSIRDQAAALGDLVKNKDIDLFTSGLLLSGLMGSSAITVSYHTLTTLVRDRERRIDYDIAATPIRRWQIVLSYFTASVLSAILMTTAILTVGLVILCSSGDPCLSAGSAAKLYGITVLAAVSATALFMIPVLFFQSTSASGAFFGLLSAAAGFVIGAFMPISTFSKQVQTVCGLFPGTGVTWLYRRTLLKGILKHMDEGIGGLDGGAFARGLEDTFCPPVRLLGTDLTVRGVIVYVLAVAAVCVAIICILFPKVYKRK